MIMLNELKRIMQENKMIAVYADNNDYDYFYAGYIQAVDEMGLLLSKQNYGGYNNGFVFFTDIIHFETDSIDTERHEKLYHLRGIKPDTFEIDAKDNLFEELLKVCHQKQLCCNIFKKEDDEGDRIGFISEIHENHIILKCIDRYGEYYAKAYIEKSDIFRIFIEGEYEETVRMLYENK